MPAGEHGQHLEPLRRLVVLGQRAFEWQRGTLGEHPDMAAWQPGGEVVGDAVRLLVGSHHDDHRPAIGHHHPTSRQVGGPRRGGDAQRIASGRRQVRDQLGGERGDPTVSAATGGGDHAGGTARSRPLNSFMAAAVLR